MSTYALLVQPSFNRVYLRAAPAVLQAELSAADASVLGGRLRNVRLVRRGGVPFVEFDTDEPLGADDLEVLVNLSAVYLLCEVRDDLLAPCDVPRLAVYDDDLLTILRYAGKTNEQFTALLVNLGLLAATGTVERIRAGEPVRVLDPLFGRGTTLNQALMYGLDAGGIEIDPRHVEAYVQFIRKWLEDKRIKHRVQCWRYRKGRPAAAHRTTIVISRRTGGGTVEQVLDVCTDDTVNARDHFRRASVDAIVGDLPYGVQHEARTDRWGRSRNAELLLAEALPVWRSVLRPAGSLTLSWNCRQLSKEEMAAAVQAAGFAVEDFGGVSFRHRVDRTITRDVIVARKPA